MGMIHRTHKHGDASFRGQIQMVPDIQNRPLWSVMIPTFNCAHYLERTLKSVLEQDPGPGQMQIEVVDDHSTKDVPIKVVRAVEGERVTFFRQPRNLGTVGNLNTCINRASGRLVHLLHGDDLVLPGFYAAMTDVFDRYPEVGAAFCRHIYIDEDGHHLQSGPEYSDYRGVIKNPAGFLGTEQRIMTPSICVRRKVYEELAGFDRRLVYAEDWEMWMRIASKYSIYYVGDALCCYRMHENSNTGRSILEALDLEDTRLTIDMFSHYFPSTISRTMRRKARYTYSQTALWMADKLIQQHQYRGAVNQLRVSLKLNTSLSHCAHVVSRLSSIAARKLNLHSSPHESNSSHV